MARFQKSHDANERIGHWPGQVMSDPKRVMRNPSNPYFLTAFNRYGQWVQELLNAFDDAVLPEKKGAPCIPEHGTKLAQNFLSQFVNHLQLRAYIKEIAQEKATRINAVENDRPLLEAAEDAHLSVIQICFEFPNDRPKKASFYFEKSVQTNVAIKGALDNRKERIIEKCVQSSYFMDAFSPRSLIYTHIVLPDAKCILQNVLEQSIKNGETKKVVEVPFSTLSFTLASSRTIIKLRKRRH